MRLPLPIFRTIEGGRNKKYFIQLPLRYNEYKNFFPLTGSINPKEIHHFFLFCIYCPRKFIVNSKPPRRWEKSYLKHNKQPSIDLKHMKQNSHRNALYSIKHVNVVHLDKRKYEKKRTLVTEWVNDWLKDGPIHERASPLKNTLGGKWWSV